MTNEDLECLMIHTLQNMLPPFAEKNSLTLTTTTLDHITAGTLYAHIDIVANDTITTLKHEFEFTAITDAPSAVNDKIKINTLEKHKQNRDYKCTPQKLNHRNPRTTERHGYNTLITQSHST